MMKQFMKDSRDVKAVEEAVRGLQGGSRGTRSDWDEEDSAHWIAAFTAFLYNEAIGKVGGAKLRCQVAVISDIDPEGPEYLSGERKWSYGFLPGESPDYLAQPQMVRSIQGTSLDGMCDYRTGVYLDRGQADALGYCFHGTQKEKL